MATILQGVCSACGYESRSVAARSMSVRVSDGEEVILPHPLERLRLKELGLSWRTARRNNMLRYYRAVVCDGCGELQSHDARDPRLHPPAEARIKLAGRLLSIVFATAGVTLALRSFGAGWTGGTLAVAFLVLGVVLGQISKPGLEAVLRRLSPDTDSAAVSELICERCQRGRLYSVPASAMPAAGSQTDCFPCPTCGAMEVQFRIVGIS